MKYKIGEVSKILNIPMETLRYLEKKGIVNPSKNDNNNYRFYDHWDINFLIEYKKFRSLEFSSSEIEEILHFDNLENFIDRINTQQDYIEKKLKYYTLLKQKNDEYRNSLNNIKDNLGKYMFMEHPDIYYFTHRFNYKYETKDKFEGLFEIWVNYFPFVEPLLEIKFESMIDRSNNNEYAWGFALKKEYIDAFEIPLNDKVKHVGKVQSVYTVIVAGEKGTFSLNLLDNAMKFIEDNGYKLSGNVTGNLIARTHEERGYSRYIEVWLPVKKVC